MSRRSRILAALSLGLIGAPLLAAPADVVRTRIAGLRELGAAFKNANDALRGGEPQTIMIRQSAREIVSAALPGEPLYGMTPLAGLPLGFVPATTKQHQ